MGKTNSTCQQREALLQNIKSNMIQHIQHFTKKELFLYVGLLSAEQLKMLNGVGLWSEISVKLEEPHGPKNIQYINISAERSTFPEP